jgi:thymidylate synthase
MNNENVTETSARHASGKSSSLMRYSKRTRYTNEWRLCVSTKILFEGTARECRDWLSENVPIENLRIERKHVFEGWAWEEELEADLRKEADEELPDECPHGVPMRYALNCEECLEMRRIWSKNESR